MAKLHSLVSSNSFNCLSFMMHWVSAFESFADKACCDTGVIVPFIFIAGGKPAVINRSDPSLSSISFNNLRIKDIASFLSIGISY